MASVFLICLGERGTALTPGPSPIGRGENFGVGVGCGWLGMVCGMDSRSFGCAQDDRVCDVWPTPLAPLPIGEGGCSFFAKGGEFSGIGGLVEWAAARADTQVCPYRELGASAEQVSGPPTGQSGGISGPSAGSGRHDLWPGGLGRLCGSWLWELVMGVWAATRVLSLSAMRGWTLVVTRGLILAATGGWPLRRGGVQP